MFRETLDNLKRNTPLVHNITNYVTVNDCANVLLACNASPIMADDVREVEDITAICQALVINIGTLNERTIESMVKAGRKSNELNHPVILDPVGAGASRFRTETTFHLLSEVKFTVIRGNISEIKTVYAGSGNTKGVDADLSDEVTEENLIDTVKFAQHLSHKTRAIIVITGAIDIVVDQSKAYVIRNGHSSMSRITGTGCMLTALIGAFCAANEEQRMEAVAVAVSAMGICGELAYMKTQNTEGGTSSLKIHLLDYISKLTPELLEAHSKIELLKG